MTSRFQEALANILRFSVMHNLTNAVLSWRVVAFGQSLPVYVGEQERELKKEAVKAVCIREMNPGFGFHLIKR